MRRQIFDAGPLAAGAAIAGASVGLAEALYRDVDLVYGAMLGGAACAMVGALASVALAATRRGREMPHGLLTAGFLCTLVPWLSVLGRFVLLRDVFHEAPSKRWLATLLAVVAALALVAPVVAARRWIRRRFFADRVPGWLGWTAPATMLAVFALLTQRADDAPTQASPSPQPLRGSGVILVVVDTLRADALGAYGASLHRDAAASPHFDRLAREGRLYVDTTAQASWTKPAVASLLTSRHASGHATMSKSAMLPAALPTLASELAAHAVHTGAVVTNYNLEPGFGFERGFEHYEYLAPARYLGGPPRANRLALYNAYRLLRERWLTLGREERYFSRSGRAVNAAGLAWLDRVGNESFFLYLHYMEPHDPYFADDATLTSYARVTTPNPRLEVAAAMHLAYRDDVRRFDVMLGELDAALAARGLTERATLIVTSDHGEEFGEHGAFWHGTSLYEHQLDVPLVIRGPGAAQGRDTSIARQIDIAPTVLGRFGHTAPASWEGRDLLGASPAPSRVLAEQDHDGHQLRAIREGNRKLILANPDNPRGLAPTELYDLAQDPGERQNAAATSPAEVEALTKHLDAGLDQSRVGGARHSQRKTTPDMEAELRSLGYVK